MRKNDRRRPDRTRSGITLVEVMTALVLVAAGCLAMAGSSALLVRAAGGQAAEHAAIRRISLRLAWLAASGCAGAREGIADDARTGARESWRVSPLARGAATVEDSVTWHAPTGERRLVVRTALLC